MFDWINWSKDKIKKSGQRDAKLESNSNLIQAPLTPNENHHVWQMWWQSDKKCEHGMPNIFGPLTDKQISNIFNISPIFCQRNKVMDAKMLDDMIQKNTEWT